VRAEGGLDITQSLLAYLANRQMLLLLDNCEHLIEECAAVARKLLGTASALRVLATSREALEVLGEVVWPVPTLEAGVAEELFRARAALADPGFAPTAADEACIREICRRLDGVPLAIELAAARAGTLELSEISARLGDSLRLLSGGRRADLPRQQTLRATIDWSYYLLAEDERRLFERLSVFDGSFTLDSAEAVGSCDLVAARDVVDVFTRLVAKSLVTKEQGGPGSARYRLLDTLRQYGRERLEERGGRSDVEEAHASYWQRWLRAGLERVFRPESGDWHRRVEAEQPNLRAAMAWSFANDAAAAAAVDIVAVCGWSWFVRGMCDEVRPWVDAAARATEGERTTRRAEVLYALSSCAMSAADIATATAAARACVELGRELDEPHLISRGLEFASIGAWAHGDFPLAEELIKDGCEAARDRSPWDFATSHANWARVRKSRGDLEGAGELASRSVELCEQIGESHSLGWAFDVAADVALARGELDAASANAERSLAYYRDVGYEEGVASALNRLGDIALVRAGWAEAEDAYVQAAALAERIGHRGGRVAALEGFARAAESQGDPERAAGALRTARALRDEAGLRRLPEEADALEGLEERLRLHGFSL
jgi:predicted ATPase